MSEYGKNKLSITITTDIADPDEAIRWINEQLGAALGTAGDEGGEGWHNKKMGTPRWQVASIQAVRDSGTERKG